ncbi:MAG: hypothetical protein V2I67_06355 [Thermoanaerobaculales bacterium]|jgi:hypothetical protein|nr:hypothetical protein [Thermoanaerobaculales bacterium]
MRTILTLLVALMALPAAADEGFSLGLAEMDFSEPEPAAVNLAMTAGETGVGHAEALAFQAALKPKDANEYTLALWNSEMGRVHYLLASEQARLGREGLVNGERMLGVGLGTTAIGDNDPNGAFILGRHKWAEMNANEKFRAGVEVSVLAGILYALATLAD